MTRLFTYISIAIGFLTSSAPAVAGDSDDYWNRPCEVKVESKRGEFKRETKCQDGIGAHWRGEWKEEFRDGRCWIKLEATREVFKEEVKCEDRH